MRTIKVKLGTSKYKLQSDKGVYIGELIIFYELGQCSIWIQKRGANINELKIGVPGT